MDTETFETEWKPWALPVASGFVGLLVGAGTSYLYFRRKFNRDTEETFQEIDELKHEQLKLDFERAEKDREFNKAIGEATLVSRQMAMQGQNLVDVLNHFRPPVVIEGDTLEQSTETQEPVAVISEGLDEVPQPQLVTDPDERPDGNRRLKKLVSSQPRMVEPVTSNVFDNTGDWNYEAELSSRDPEEPYVIHVDEYMNDEMGYENQSTMTYYVGDDILADEKDVPVYDYASKVGELKFGHGSNDPNTVFVRNEKLEAEYEILRDPGSFEETVLGNTVENRFAAADLKHMNSPRRFRDD